MRRAFLFLVAVAVWLGMVGLVGAGEEAPKSAVAVAYTYPPVYDEPENYTSPERGPPVTTDNHATISDAVDLGSHSALARPRDSATRTIGFLSVEERGDSRIYFIRPLLKVGGDRGREVVEGLRADPVFGDEATALLKGRRK